MTSAKQLQMSHSIYHPCCLTRSMFAIQSNCWNKQNKIQWNISSHLKTCIYTKCGEKLKNCNNRVIQVFINNCYKLMKPSGGHFLSSRPSGIRWIHSSTGIQNDACILWNHKKKLYLFIRCPSYSRFSISFFRELSRFCSLTVTACVVRQL